MWTGCIWLRMGPEAGPCEHGNEPSGSIKVGDCKEGLCSMELVS